MSKLREYLSIWIKDNNITADSYGNITEYLELFINDFEKQTTGTYRIKHKPTGLYYCAVKGNGDTKTHFSKTGKVYHSIDNAKRAECFSSSRMLHVSKSQYIIFDLCKIPLIPVPWSKTEKTINNNITDWEIEIV